MDRFQMEYTVSDTDTIERIAAVHDCTVGELTKLNKMGSRMVFPGQKILVPLKNDDVFNESSACAAGAQGTKLNPIAAGHESMADGIRKGPGGAIPARRGSLTKTKSAPVGSSTQSEDADEDCLQRFLKIKVKQLTESDGNVNGTLLITPNCLMFDPDVSHPLVKENGSDLYGMVANMEEIVSVSVYKEFSSIMGDITEKKKEIFDPEHVRTPPHTPAKSAKSTDSVDASEIEQKSGAEQKEEIERAIDIPGSEADPSKVDFSLGSYQDASQSFKTEDSDSASDVDDQSNSQSKLMTSETYLPSISEETNKIESPEESGEKRRTYSEATASAIDVRRRSRSPNSQSSEDRPRSFSELDAPPTPTGIGRFSPNAARRSFGKLGRTLSARAKSIQGQVAQGAEKVAQTAVQGTKTVVTHTKSAADSIQTGIETGVKAVGEVAVTQAKAAVDIAGRVVDKSQSIVSDGINGVQDLFTVEEQRTVSQIRREQSLAKLEDLKQRTKKARDDAVASGAADAIFACATSVDEGPDVLANVDKLIDRQHSNGSVPASPQLPYYMAVRLTRKRRKLRRASPSQFSTSYEDDIAFGNRLKREFWYAIPPNKAYFIYHFLLKWSPEKYGQDTTAEGENQNSVETGEDMQRTVHKNGKGGFIILDANDDDKLAGDKPSNMFGSSLLNREWELVTVSEMCRRLDLDELDKEDEMPIPQGANQSMILDEIMIRQIMDILPPRAEGYPWVQIYNSEKHGFSLSTFYRKMAEFDEDLSPVLLIIRDTKEHVFGAVVSSAIRPNDHFFGTGDSCFLWRFTGEVPHTRELRQYAWTGDNQFFVMASKDSLAIGAGRGHNGLWLDADLNHGRSQRCKTFDNEPLADDDEDFVVQFIEAFGFRM
ncbi:hypothetical protein WR25_11588 [Diploscapter pachys]|uniref:Oxidation resistance protein 1 n=1 Tax=Diploscapter pachys TaxID=2018661 RepID=A0A2A2KR42_9BILA|nr:hypothetical protein WR25_11588 [Diploscapter pachys]